MDTPAANSSETIKERVKASYDAIAPAYNEWTIPHSKLRMKYLDKALGYLKLEEHASNPAFLELGCGCGLPVTKRLLAVHPGAKVVANDLSDKQISLARENLIKGPDDATARRLELVPGDMNKLSFPDGSLDLVAGFYSIIHLPRAEQTALFERIAQWLKPGGCFVANFSAEESESAVAERWLDQSKGWMFWSGWGKEKTLESMKKAGFEILVADVETDEVDATSFLWVIAKR
ncbi:S-adenosyl-L-methionine-dependent methyltransferase [Xylaria sp. FL0933]|nr:S-adenosyl-L-methionine-dependent methyltransferase [Xylaria sp. FL0933]